MSDRNDARLRELTFRLIEMAPDAPAYPEEPMVQLKQTPAPFGARLSPAMWAVAAAVVILAAIGIPLLLAQGSNAPVTDPPEPTVPAIEETTTTTMQETTTTVPETTTTVPETTTTTTTVPETTTTTVPETPGEPFDSGPPAGAVLGVVGVAYNDVLNVRSGPGTSFPVIAELDPLADDVVATGKGRLLPGAIWYEVTASGATGWVNSSFVAYLGGTSDVTAQVVAILGESPTAPTLGELGEIVVAVFASEDPPSRVTTTVAPATGDLGEVTYDVIGLGDDSVLGVRIHLFAEQTEDGYTLRTVEDTVLCLRGFSDGLCV